MRILGIVVTGLLILSSFGEEDDSGIDKCIRKSSLVAELPSPALNTSNEIAKSIRI